ncbi:MAG: ParA family protein [Haloplanus sp.]
MSETDEATTAALVGATGGAGTTRLAIELSAALAVEGHEVAVLDAAFATQGLSDYLDGRLAPDATALVTDDADAPLTDGLVDLSLDANAGRVACCPAYAPFERLARAKSPDAARAFEARIEEAADAFDYVLVDTPPVAANQSVAAATACERRAVVAPATGRGRDAVQRTTGRLADLDADVDAVVTTRGELEVADASIPETEAAVSAAPTCLDDGGVAAATSEVAAVLFGAELSLGGNAGFLDSVGEFVSR